MTQPAYEYRGMMAKTWDLFRGDTSGWEDRSFFLEFIREQGEPALDVGCGTGRLLLDYLSQGIDIDGLDNSPEMLALCQQKAADMDLHPTLYEGSMQTMQLPRHYRTILVPSSTFQLLLDEEQAQTAMKRFYSHLLPGGRLVMPFMLLWKRSDPLETPWHLSGEKIRPGDGATVRRWSYTRFDPQTRLEHTEDRYEVLRDGEVVATEHHVQTPATREYSQQQALQLFERAGFKQIVMYKGFNRIPASVEDWVFSIVGTKPAR